MVDKAIKKEVKMVYYPTNKMVADFSTKLTQEKVFVFHCNIIIGVSLRSLVFISNGIKKL